MNLIFITRKLDRDDPRTGFIFTWVEKLARELDEVYIICQEKGKLGDLPPNVIVESFGKEKGYGRLRQLFKFWLLIFRFAKKSNGFFLHMHPVYAIAAWPIALLFGRRLVLWYVHKAVDFKLRIAHALVNHVLTASTESFRLPSKKVKVVGHGIDMNKFQISNLKSQINSKFRIISVGRISPVKDYETLVKAIEILRDQGVSEIELKIYGSAELPAEKVYLDSLASFVREGELEDLVKFEGPLTYDFVDEVYREADLFMSSSQTGSIDKAVLEAAACGIIVLTSNEAFAEPLRTISPFLYFPRDNPHDLAQKLVQIKSWPADKKQEVQAALHAWVEREHNLNNLVKEIVKEFI